MFFEKHTDEMVLTEVDKLSNDLVQHCADLAENYCGDKNCSACLAYALNAKGYRRAPDVAREIFSDIEYVLINVGYFDATDFDRLQRKYFVGKYNEYKKID